jgi:mannosyltransferase OCH1-like enzyme
MPTDFVRLVETNILPGYSFYFHDDEAMDRFLAQPFPEFPLWLNASSCLRPGAAKADIWRYLMIWEHGGVYVDIDELFSPLFNSTTILPDDDSFFPKHPRGYPCQFFFAACQFHPAVKYAIEAALEFVAKSTA